jgi:ribonuclease HI
MGILKRHHIEEYGKCVLCGHPDESIFHAIISCTCVIGAWKAIKDATGVRLPHLHPNTWTSDIINGRVCSRYDAEVITTATYSIWTSRNKQKQGKQHFSTRQSALWIAEVIQEVCSAIRPSKHDTVNNAIRWQPPPNAWVKINVDGSFNPSSTTGSTGCIARDHDGHFLAARSRWNNYAQNALITEALACRDGIELAKSLGVQQVIIETDCQNIVNHWNNRRNERSEIMGILHQVQTHASQLAGCSLQFTRRETNYAAHLCAKQASCENINISWVGMTPPFLVSCIEHDCNLLGNI